jgi:hypothetical protein
MNFQRFGKKILRKFLVNTLVRRDASNCLFLGLCSG